MSDALRMTIVHVINGKFYVCIADRGEKFREVTPEELRNLLNL